jgi:hypothetical protein
VLGGGEKVSAVRIRKRLAGLRAAIAGFFARCYEEPGYATGEPIEDWSDDLHRYIRSLKMEAFAPWSVDKNGQRIASRSLGLTLQSRQSR